MTAAIKVELDALREDKARLDWLIANARTGETLTWIEYGFQRGKDAREMMDLDRMSLDQLAGLVRAVNGVKHAKKLKRVAQVLRDETVKRQLKRRYDRETGTFKTYRA